MFEKTDVTKDSTGHLGRWLAFFLFMTPPPLVIVSPIRFSCLGLSKAPLSSQLSKTTAPLVFPSHSAVRELPPRRKLALVGLTWLVPFSQSVLRVVQCLETVVPCSTVYSGAVILDRFTPFWTEVETDPNSGPAPALEAQGTCRGTQEPLQANLRATAQYLPSLASSSLLSQQWHTCASVPQTTDPISTEKQVGNHRLRASIVGLLFISTVWLHLDMQVRPRGLGWRWFQPTAQLPLEPPCSPALRSHGRC